jgi:carboxymethylenebutenolidase
MGTLEMPNTLSDVQAAIDYLAKDGKVGVVGYCFGGLLTWLSAADANNIACASGYYGGGIAQSIEKAPKVPTILHFGDLDAHIPIPDVKSIDEAHPEVMVYTYDADHGFNCDHRGSYNESAAALARQRTVGFFEQYLG